MYRCNFNRYNSVVKITIKSNIYFRKIIILNPNRYFTQRDKLMGKKRMAKPLGYLWLT